VALKISYEMMDSLWYQLGVLWADIGNSEL